MLPTLRNVGPIWPFWGGGLQSPHLPCPRHFSVKPASSIFAISLCVVCVLSQGYRKHSLLREILPIIGAELRLQRLFSEYQQQLASTAQASSLSWFHVTWQTASFWSQTASFWSKTASVWSQPPSYIMCSVSRHVQNGSNELNWTEMNCQFVCFVLSVQLNWDFSSVKSLRTHFYPVP